MFYQVRSSRLTKPTEIHRSTFEGDCIRAWLCSANIPLESDVSPFVSKFMTVLFRRFTLRNFDKSKKKKKQPTKLNNDNFINNFNQLNTFRAIISPILRSTRLCLQSMLSAGSIVGALYHKL